MTLTASMRASQVRAGQPIRLEAVTATNDVSDNWTATGAAVTTANTPPATMAAIAHLEEFTYVGSPHFIDAQSDRQNSTTAAGTQTTYQDRSQWRKNAITLDSNFVAGRYLWVVMINGPAGTSTTPVVAHSASYLIR